MGGAVTPLASLAPADPAGLRDGDGPVSVPGARGGVRVRNPSVLTYAIGGKGFARFRGFIGIENPLSTQARAAFIPGQFICPHGAYFDRDGNIFVVAWVEVGRVTKLRKVA